MTGVLRSFGLRTKILPKPSFFFASRTGLFFAFFYGAALAACDQGLLPTRPNPHDANDAQQTSRVLLGHVERYTQGDLRAFAHCPSSPTCAHRLERLGLARAAKFYWSTSRLKTTSKTHLCRLRCSLAKRLIDARGQASILYARAAGPVTTLLDMRLHRSTSHVPSVTRRGDASPAVPSGVQTTLPTSCPSLRAETGLSPTLQQNPVTTRRS